MIQAQSTQKTINLLLIDDDLVDCKIFKKCISKLQHNINLVECYSPAQALDLLHQKTFDCIFLDYQLPATNGLELLEKFAQLNITIPVTIMTSQGDEQLAADMFKAGAIDYIGKADISAEKIERTLNYVQNLNTLRAEKQKADVIFKSYSANLEAILESTGSAVYAMDREYKLTVFNSAHKKNMKRLYDIDIEIGSTFVGHPNVKLDQEQELQNLNRALSGMQFTLEQEYGMKGKTRSFYEVSYNPVQNDNGAIIGVAVYAQDITEKRRAQQALLDARNEALKAARAKSDFLSNMSHEIRTPMNAIIGITDLLLEKQHSVEDTEYLNSIRYSADNLLVIINDILDFSKLEAGKITFEQIPFDLFKKLAELIKSFKFQTDEKQLYLSLIVHPDVPQFLKGDPYRLNQILFNLVGNAVKFTQTGGITIQVKVKQKIHNKFLINFAITDTGIGVAREKMDTIFESFTQAYTDTSRKFGGTGLGLAITKNLVELQNGYIGLKSQINRGSTFYFDLAYEEADENGIQEVVKEPAYRQSLSGYHILLVEDNAMNQLVAKQILLKWDAQVGIASNGKQALEKLAETTYDLVLMDLQMPEMNGYETTACIRENNPQVLNPKIPIIALTADAFEETRSRVFNTGMNDFVTKPFKQDELFSKIYHLLKK